MKIKLFLHDDGRLLYSRNWPEPPPIKASIYQDESALRDWRLQVAYLCDPRRAITVVNPEFVLGCVERESNRFYDIEECGFEIDSGKQTIVIFSFKGPHIKWAFQFLLTKLRRVLQDAGDAVKVEFQTKPGEFHIYSHKDGKPFGTEYRQVFSPLDSVAEEDAYRRLMLDIMTSGMFNPHYTPAGPAKDVE